MKTRRDYIDGKATFSEYYRQFITPSLIDAVKSKIGIDAVKGSNDPQLNDIPLKKWDSLFLDNNLKNGIALKMQEAGDYLSFAGAVCTAKECARILAAQA
jgi:hypothetical protein